MKTWAPLDTVHTALPFNTKRRRLENTEKFIQFLRQLAALLAAGRSLSNVWHDLLEVHPPCKKTPDIDDVDPGCCLHHVLVANRAAQLTAQTFFAHTTGPGEERYWQQLHGALSMVQTTGLPAAVVLDRLADALESGQDAQQARDAAAAGPKTTATLLSWLPVAGLGLSALLGTTILDLLGEPIGWVLASLGLILTGLGRWWAQKMIKAAQT